jgi:uncharacterized protein (TIGR01777 family)
VKIVVAGGSGFLGQPLCAALARDKHDVVILSRGWGTGVGRIRTVAWSPGDAGGEWTKEIDGADAVINLAGAGIADRRWTQARKKELVDSRVTSTRALVGAIKNASKRPATLISGSAIGYYPSDLNETLDEHASPGADFLARLCVAWETEARTAEPLGCRVVLNRTGLVIAADGGIVKKMKLPFLLYGGGPIGTGKQWMSWIHRDDWIAMMRWLLVDTSVKGPVNLVGPAPVTNAEFSRAFGRALNRPSWLPMPAAVLRILVGEMADGALLTSHRVAPAVAAKAGFKFQYETVDAALASLRP